MNTTVINIKTDYAIKSKAQAIAEELGLSLSAVINVLLKQFVRTKSINVSLREEPSPWLVKALKESEEDIKKGRVYSFNNTKEGLNFLRDKSKKKYVAKLKKS